MTYLNPKDNRDIIEKIRRRYLVKGIACAGIFLAEASLFLLFGWASFTEKFGVGNGAAVLIILAAVPFFLTGLYRDLTDRSWEGTVTSAKKVIVKKNAKYATASDHGDPYADYIKLTVELGDGETKTVFAHMDELALFRKGDRIRHIRGTKYYQLYRESRNRTDCVMCGTYAENPCRTCPKCGFSMVKYNPPEEV